MEQISLTPFGRQPMTAELLAARRQGAHAPALSRIDKWSVFNDLRLARRHFAVSDRDLTVLHALLSFLPEKQLEDSAGLVVFPSNASLSERAHGMAESTLRRHLGALVAAGLIWRHDSPNGKRFARRDRAGEITRAFGFDLRPLLTRAPEIAEAAAVQRAEAEEIRRAREALVLLTRDLGKLRITAEELAAGVEVDAALATLKLALRRQLGLAEIARLHALATRMLKAMPLPKTPQFGATQPLPCAAELSGSAAQNERHYTNTDKEFTESEEGARPARSQSFPPAMPPADPPFAERPPSPDLALEQVLAACPELKNFTSNRLRSWEDLVRSAMSIRAMLGISDSAWAEAMAVMGRETAAVAVAAILQRFDRIRSPGGYLRSLSARAGQGKFSIRAMVLALLPDLPPGLPSPRALGQS